MSDEPKQGECIMEMKDETPTFRTWEIVECKSCHRRIFFVPTEKGKMIPLREKAQSGGNIMIRNGIAVYKSKKNVPEKGETLWVSHFADCPNAAQFRSKKPE